MIVGGPGNEEDEVAADDRFWHERHGDKSPVFRGDGRDEQVPRFGLAHFTEKRRAFRQVPRGLPPAVPTVVPHTVDAIADLGHRADLSGEASFSQRHHRARR